MADLEFLCFFVGLAYPCNKVSPGSCSTSSSIRPRIRPRRPAVRRSAPKQANQATSLNSASSAVPVLISLSMAWSPPARQRRSWLVEQAGEYATQISHHIRDGTEGFDVVFMHTLVSHVATPMEAGKGWVIAHALRAGPALPGAGC